MKSSVFVLSLFMGGLAVVATPAWAESQPPQSTQVVITNFNEPVNADTTTAAESEDVVGTDDVAAADDQGDDNDDQGDDNDNQGGDDNGDSGGGDQGDQGD